MDAAAVGSVAFDVAEHVETPTRRALRRLRNRQGAMLGLVVIVAFILLALLAPLVAPYDPAAQSWAAVRKPPSALHWLGTDEVGRDILARIIFGFFPIAIYFIIASYAVYLVMNSTSFAHRIFRRMTLLQIVTTDLLLVLMLALPVKILLRLIFRVKYIWVTPWFSI